MLRGTIMRVLFRRCLMTVAAAKKRLHSWSVSKHKNGCGIRGVVKSAIRDVRFTYADTYHDKTRPKQMKVSPKFCNVLLALNLDERENGNAWREISGAYVETAFSRRVHQLCARCCILHVINNAQS